MNRKLTKRTVEATQPASKDIFVWDTETKGFGLKVTPAGNRIYLLQARLDGRSIRCTIGKHGSPWTPDQARDDAVRKLAQITDGINPNEIRAAERNALSVSELCDLYLEEGCGLKKQSTIDIESGMIKRHITPLLGKRRVKDLNRGDIERFLNDVSNGKTAINSKGDKPRSRITVKGGKATANRTTDLLAAMLTFAVDRKMRADNPARGVKKFRLQARERFLSPKELARLGEALTNAENEYLHAQKLAKKGEKRKSGQKGKADPPNGENPFAIAALKLLILTGCRKNEILSLRWEYVDFERALLRLPDSKTGAKTVPLGAPALQILNDLNQIKGNPHVFPSARGDGHFVGLRKVWTRIRERAKLSGVRIHDLRHSFASVGVAGGDSLYIVGKLLGHKQARTTERYAHLADDPLREASERISSHISNIMSGKPTSEVVDLKAAKNNRQ